MVFLFCENVTNILIESIFLKKVLDFYTQWVYNKDTKGKQRAFPNDRKEKIMKNLMRVKTECYDCAYHTEVEPYGVQDYDLIGGKLYYSDEYEWILVDNFGTEILTDVGYDDEDLGQFPEKALDLIKYLISDAPKKGYVECASREEAEEICECLGEDCD